MVRRRRYEQQRKEGEEEEKRRETRRRDWSALPDGILGGSIMMKLNLVDLSSFSRVCSSWAWAAQLWRKAYAASSPPLVHVCRLRDYSSYDDVFYSLAERRYLRIRRSEEPSKGGGVIHHRDLVRELCSGYWVVHRRGKFHRVCLVHPLTGRVAVARFPPMWDVHWLCRYLLLLPPPTSLLLRVNRDAVQWCRPGDARWSTTTPGAGRALIPVLSAAVDGQLYVVTEGGELLAMGFVPSPAVRVVEAADGEMITGCCALVAAGSAGGELLAVRRRLGEGTAGGFAVFRLAGGAWEVAGDLRGRALLLDLCAPVICDPAPWGGPPDAIFFFDTCEFERPGLGLFHMRDGRTERVPLPAIPHYAGFLLPALCAAFPF